MSVVLQFSVDVMIMNVDAVVHHRDSKAEKLLGARIDGGIQIRPTSYRKSEHIESVVLPLNTGQEEFFFNFLLEKIGKPYDMSPITDFDVDRDWRYGESWTSSELMAAALEHCGFFPYPLASLTNRITPVDLWLAISARIPVDVR